ncbi:LTA synthase family protein [Methylobacter sp. S3L5C]|uniref:LTA synthase family protein n=1 Tax=Methylobacter sp. S3L5C TaxID=2839024 RepID=UPI001FAD3292|nr:LTA synthase family protein [Methylobacter sp. S3L5C]UOA10369.1 LTA synthase family protein [Methylobacter sp. S3L5C]
MTDCFIANKKKFLPVFSTTLFYLLYYLVSTFKFDVQIDISAIFYDFLLQLGVSYILFSLSKHTWIFLIIQALMMGVLYVGNAVKISFFGGPIMPDDVYALRSLLLILEGWRFMVVAIPMAAIVSLLLFNFTMHHRSAYLASLTAILLGIILVYEPILILDPLDKHMWYSVWDQRSNYLMRGATFYTLQESARYFASVDKSPDPDEAQIAAENLLMAVPAKPSVADIKPFTPRNIHIVLLESFWDPNELKKADYKQNPLSPEFRKLWKSAGYSHALDPVFGGYTANSEFEVLCGFPVTKDAVKFERQLVNDVPCLPNILADKGYRTVVSHPNVPVFWNRVNSYRNLGFQTYWSIQDFVLDDMNREFLSDTSLYRQVLEKISGSLEAKQPVLDYIVTYFGHWNYPLSKSRPDKVSSTSEVEEVSTYANTIYYKSRELMAFLDQLRQRDPDGIIVAFGDHLPFLGENFAGYVDSGVLNDNRSEFTPEMFKFYVSTPMIIIDGKNGPVKFGSLPLYQVPKLLLNLLNYNEPTIMDYVTPLPHMRVRSLPGLHIDLLKDGKIALCKEPPYSPSCLESSRWLQDVSVVSNDLFIGRQYTRPKRVPAQQVVIVPAPAVQPPVNVPD